MENEVKAFGMGDLMPMPSGRCGSVKGLSLVVVDMRMIMIDAQRRMML